MRRAAAGLLVLALVAAGFGATRQPARAAAAPPLGSLRTEDASREAVRRGQLAMEDGFLREAELWFRAAHTHPQVRVEAADQLRRLDVHPGFRLDVDEAQLSQALAELPRGYRRIESRHFVVLSDADPAWVRSRIAMMEKTRHEYFRAVRKIDPGVVPHQHKLLCVLMEHYEDFLEFSRRQDGVVSAWVAGYYSVPQNRVVFYNDANGPAFGSALRSLAGRESELRPAVRHAGGGGPRAIGASAPADQGAQVRRVREEIEADARNFAVAKTVHETVHLLAFNTGLQRRDRAYPLWLSEGLASSFETHETTGLFGPERPSPIRQASFERLRDEGRLMPWARLVTLLEVPEGEPDSVEQIYAQAHTLLTLLYRTERQALGAYFQELSARNLSTAEHLAAFERHFGPVSRLRLTLGGE
ncbi:MAG: DUF1570 domain-containing protein [Phycisphaeraceae bacterium]|nr:DUF1570 domain-containing protein [Phycisphaeraceae bacterium]MCW5754541.1 DUF1570 domain-containing protein [Phycisphaeraceae bacterium]